MKGIIIANEESDDLYPITKICSKYSLPLYDKPMIYYPLNCLLQIGINEILIVLSKNNYEEVKQIINNGNFIGINVEYVLQEKESAIEDVIRLNNHYIEKDTVAVIYGNNFFYSHDFSKILKQSKEKVEKNNESFIFVSQSTQKCENPVLIINNSKMLFSCSRDQGNDYNSYFSGFCFLTNDAIKSINVNDNKPLFEIKNTLFINKLLEKNTSIEILGREVVWTILNSYENLNELSNLVASVQKSLGQYVGCIEETAYKNGWINKEQLCCIAKGYQSDYKLYLENLK